MSKSLAWVVVACVFVIACGDDTTVGGNAAGTGAGSGMGGAGSSAAGTVGEAGDGGTSGASGTAGPSDAGGTGGVGGAAGAGGTGGADIDYDPAAHCSPGDFVPPLMFAYSSAPNRAKTCVGDDYPAAGEAGLFDELPMVRLALWSIELAQPMAAGEPYSLAFEVELRTGPQDTLSFEVWGTTAHCGAGSSAQLLSETTLAPVKQVICLDLTPENAYSHLMIVARDVDDVRLESKQTVVLGGATFCAAGMCP